MSIQWQMNRLRSQVTAHLDRFQELTMQRNVLLQMAATDPRPDVARALRENRLLADQARRAARLARAQLAALEMEGDCPNACPPPRR